MLNLFPIQFLAPFAYFLLRAVLGLVLLYLGSRHLKNRATLAPIFTFSFFPFGAFVAWYLGSVELIVGSMLVVGFLTQLAALLTALMALKFIIMHRKFVHPLIPSRLSYLFMLVVSLSLVITGAGIFAFDLPI